VWDYELGENEMLEILLRFDMNQLASSESGATIGECRDADLRVDRAKLSGICRSEE